MQELKSQQASLERQFREKQSVVAQSSKAIANHKVSLREKLLKSQEAQNSVEELQDMLDQDVVEEGRLEALKGQLDEAEEDVQVQEASYQDSVIAKDAASALLQECERKLDAAEGSIKDFEKQVEKAESKSTQRINDRSARLREKNDAIAALDLVRAKKEKMLDLRREQDNIFMEFQEQARQISSRVAVDVGETGESLDRKYLKIQRDLKNSQKQ